MSQNIGVLVPNTVRPNDSLDPISVIYTNEARGGHHVYETISEMYNIIEDRRDFGMLVTIYNDGTASNNKTYQLKYNYSSTASTDNSNWVVFSTDGSNSSSEWIDSVLSWTNSIPSSKSTGDRYLILDTNGTSSVTSENTWAGHGNNIAEYDASIPTWNFTIPTEGMSVRIDNEQNALYKYSGTYSPSGYWVKEYTTQVFNITATSSDGINFTSTAEIDRYSTPGVFYVSFATSSAGSSASLNIDGIGNVIIKKITGNTLYDIGASDLNTSIKYQLIYDGTYFQTMLPSSQNIIGAAEFGNTYSNGLYTDLTVNTPIGTPIDRFNQILAELVPPNATGLTALDGTSSTYAYGKLSFPSSSVTDFISATNSSYGSINLDETWNIGTTADGGIYRLGIYSSTSSSVYNVDLWGYLNYNVATNSAAPIPAYNGKAFGSANEGYIYMKINGATHGLISLTSSSALDTTSGMTIPGLSMSAATSSKFPNGGEFDVFYNRTGTWHIPKSCLRGTFTSSYNSYNIAKGYNYVEIIHNYNSVDYYTSKVEFILDDDTSTVSISNPNAGAFNTNVLSGSKSVSGIAYYTSMTLQYLVNVNNAYSNVYSNRADALVITDLTPAGLGTPVPSLGTNNKSMPAFTASYFSVTPFTVNYVINNGSNYRRINDSVSVHASKFYKPLLPSLTTTNTNGGSASLTGIVLDTVTTASGNLIEYFNNEVYRLDTGLGYDTIINVTSNPWTSTDSLISDFGLQVYNGMLQYPTLDFSSYGTLTTNLNKSNANTNYSGCTGSRTYFRYFRDTTINSSQFSIAIIGSASIVTTTPTNSSNEINMQIKLPGAGSAVTGWMNVGEGYNSVTFTGIDGDGIYNASGVSGTPGVPPGVSVNLSGAPFALNIGSKNTSSSSGYIVLRIIAPEDWTGNISSIEIKYY